MINNMNGIKPMLNGNNNWIEKSKKCSNAKHILSGVKKGKESKKCGLSIKKDLNKNNGMTKKKRKK